MLCEPAKGVLWLSEHRQGASLSGGIAHISRQQWEEAVSEVKEDKDAGQNGVVRLLQSGAYSNPMVSGCRRAQGEQSKAALLSHSYGN